MSAQRALSHEQTDRLMEVTEEIIQSVQDLIPPSLMPAEAAAVLLAAGLDLMARGALLGLPSSNEKELREKVRDFLGRRVPRLETEVLDHVMKLWEAMQERY